MLNFQSFECSAKNSHFTVFMIQLIRSCFKLKQTKNLDNCNSCRNDFLPFVLLTSEKVRINWNSLELVNFETRFQILNLSFRCWIYNKRSFFLFSIISVVLNQICKFLWDTECSRQQGHCLVLCVKDQWSTLLNPKKGTFGTFLGSTNVQSSYLYHKLHICSSNIFASKKQKGNLECAPLRLLGIRGKGYCYFLCQFHFDLLVRFYCHTISFLYRK